MKTTHCILATAMIFILGSCAKENPEPLSSQAGTEQDNAQRVSTLVVKLSGDQEVPPNNSDATGVGIFQLKNNDTELHYRLIVANIENVTMAHIHLAPAGTNGGVVVWLYPSGPPPQLISGMVNGPLAQGVITSADLVGDLAGMNLSDLIDHIQNHNAYVNVHTSQFGGGEIRGQF